MKRSRWWIRNVLVALLLAVAPAVALAAGCGTPPDSSGDWLFMDDVALNMRRVSQSSIFYGTYRVVDSAVNYESATRRDEVLSWTGTADTSYSASLKAWGAGTDSSKKQVLRTTFDLPPMYEARLQVRQAAQYDYYRFDAGCVWFNTDTHKTVTAIAQYGINGTVRRTWNQSSLTFQTAY